MKKLIRYCEPNTECCTPTSNIPRREFLELSTLGTVLLAIPFSGCDFVSQTPAGHLIPADKRLSPEWIKSLTERGVKEVKVYNSKDEFIKSFVHTSSKVFFSAKWLGIIGTLPKIILELP